MATSLQCPTAVQISSMKPQAGQMHLAVGRRALSSGSAFNQKSSTCHAFAPALHKTQAVAASYTRLPISCKKIPNPNSKFALCAEVQPGLFPRIREVKDYFATWRHLLHLKAGYQSCRAMLKRPVEGSFLPLLSDSILAHATVKPLCSVSLFGHGAPMSCNYRSDASHVVGTSDISAADKSSTAGRRGMSSGRGDSLRGRRGASAAAVDGSCQGEEEQEGKKEATMQSVKIPVQGNDADAYMDCLLSIGAASCSVEDANFGTEKEEEMFVSGPAPWQPASETRSLWNECTVTALFPPEADVASLCQLAADAVGIQIPPVLSTSNVSDDDWVSVVQRMFSPLEVVPGVWVTPSWTSPPPNSSSARLSLLLELGLAFGTGEHPTTRLCLAFLCDAMSAEGGDTSAGGGAASTGGITMVDYGMGSGILGIAAIKLGAIRAIGVDIDPLSLSSAAHNASLNEIHPESFPCLLTAVGGTDPIAENRAMLSNKGIMFGDGGDFADIVVANILVNSVVELTDRIVSYTKPGGLIALSGILVSQVDMVTEVYSKATEIMEVKEDGEWALVVCSRKLNQDEVFLS